MPWASPQRLTDRGRGARFFAGGDSMRFRCSLIASSCWHSAASACGVGMPRRSSARETRWSNTSSNFCTPAASSPAWMSFHSLAERLLDDCEVSMPSNASKTRLWRVLTSSRTSFKAFRPARSKPFAPPGSLGDATGSGAARAAVLRGDRALVGLSTLSSDLLAITSPFAAASRDRPQPAPSRLKAAERPLGGQERSDEGANIAMPGGAQRLCGAACGALGGRLLRDLLRGLLGRGDDFFDAG